ncbi:MAG: sugar transferase [Acidobacteriota bacterium]|nr:sugar transferase [Acidobacteriota bacterium]
MTTYQIIKRVFDVFFSSLLLVILSPLLFAVAILILILEGRPVFYKSRRHSDVQKIITVYKFRTMVKDAKSPKYDLHRRYMRSGYLDIPLTCEVFTPIGRWIERTQIVEIPQLFNVIAGQMSLIGNRPLPAENVELLKAHDKWQTRFDSPAGISGIAQVVGKLNLEPAERLAFEASYSNVYRNGNILKCDWLIFLHTVRTVVLAGSLPAERAHRLLRSALTSSVAISQSPSPALSRSKTAAS